MQSFVYYNPTEILFGRGAQEQAVRKIRDCGGSRVMLVYGGGSARRSGLIEKLERQLAEEGLPVLTVGGVQPNPRLAFARVCLQKARDFGADFLLAAGGGSVIDTCKAVGVGLAAPDTDLWAFWERKAVPKATVPVGVVLTIPAAGSESSDSAVLTDEAAHRKRGLNTDVIRPRFAALDPSLAATLPAYQVACGVVDIMMHTMERYFTIDRHNQLTDELAEGLLRVVIRNGRAAFADPGDYDAMSELMWAGSLSHNNLTGLGNQKDFSVHQLGHELSAMFDVAHGASLSAMWGAWAHFAMPCAPERFAGYARRVWGIRREDVTEQANAGILMTVQFFKQLGMPTCLSELHGVGVQPDGTLRRLAENCMYAGTRTVGTFCKLGIPEAYAIYSAANY